MIDDKKIKLNSEWEIKFIRENYTFPFGSLMQGYAQLFKPASLENYKQDAMILYELSMAMTEKALQRSQRSPEDLQVDFPVIDAGEGDTL